MSTQAATTGVADWESWRRQRAEAVSDRYGLLSLTGTHWLDDLADGEIPGLPGTWRQEGDDTVVWTVDGADAPLKAEGEPLVLDDGRKLQAIVREGVLGIRVWDPEAPARRNFAGIDAFDYDERWVVPAVFRPFDESRTVRLPNADGRERGFALGGTLAFTAAGAEHTVSVAIEADGRLWAVLADDTSGKTTFRFRFLYTPVPDADGALTVDLNRAQLPPCALGEGFICPFPPPGNTLPFALEAGERAVLTG